MDLSFVFNASIDVGLIFTTAPLPGARTPQAQGTKGAACLATQAQHDTDWLLSMSSIKDDTLVSNETCRLVTLLATVQQKLLSLETTALFVLLMIAASHSSGRHAEQLTKPFHKEAVIRKKIPAYEEDYTEHGPLGVKHFKVVDLKRSFFCLAA